MASMDYGSLFSNAVRGAGFMRGIAAGDVDNAVAKTVMQKSQKVMTPNFMFISTTLLFHNEEVRKLTGEWYTQIQTRVSLAFAVVSALAYSVMSLFMATLALITAPFSDEGRRFCYDSAQRALLEFGLAEVAFVGIFAPETAGELLKSGLEVYADLFIKD